MARIQVTDPVRYADYVKATPAVIAQFGGRFIVRGGAITTLEGPEETGRVVVIEFPTLEAAKSFYHSDAYQAAKALREGAATGQFLIIEGVAPG